MGYSPGASLILGGARSGKSRFAEGLAAESGLTKIYLATGQPGDGEMKDRIKQHQSRRGPDWQLIEEPTAVADAISRLADSSTCILVDCLTLWLTNLMLADGDIDQEISRLASAMGDLPAECSVLLVSNEVGQGIVPVHKMGRDFRDHAGRLHQEVAAVVPHVWFVTAGLPQKLK